MRGIHDAANLTLSAALSQAAVRRPRIFRQAEKLEHQVVEELRIIHAIASPEPRRILVDPVAPLHPSELHPIRSIFNSPGMNVEGRAHAQQEPGVELWEVLIHELFLFRGAEPYPEK